MLHVPYILRADTDVSQWGMRPRRRPGESYSSELHCCVRMPSKHPRIAVTADPELGHALERVRAATGTREADATLVRRLAVEGAQAEVQAGRGRRTAADSLFPAMDSGAFDLDLGLFDRLLG